MKQNTWISLGLVGMALSLFGAGCGEKSYLGDSGQSGLNNDDGQGTAGETSMPGDSGTKGNPPEDAAAPLATPCGGKACGDGCAIQCPAGTDCAVVEGFCDAEGICSTEAPTCRTPVRGACDGKSCGEKCVPTCAAEEGVACAPINQPTACDESGECSAESPTCSGGPPDSCLGKAAGQGCQWCFKGGGGSWVCMEGSCNAEGKCLSPLDEDNVLMPRDSCEGKACGEYCHPSPIACVSGTAGCVDPEPCFCDSDGKSSTQQPMCEALPCAKTCPTPPPVCFACADGKCATQVIVACDPACVLGDWVCADGTKISTAVP